MTTSSERPSEAAMRESEPEAAPRSAAAQELRELSLIMRHVDRLSPASKTWLRDRLSEDLGITPRSES